MALSTFGESPLTCTLGDGTLTPGLEAVLAGPDPGAEEHHPGQRLGALRRP